MIENPYRVKCFDTPEHCETYLNELAREFEIINFSAQNHGEYGHGGIWIIIRFLN